MRQSPVIAALLGLALVAHGQDTVTVPSHIEEVTVYPNSALVTRISEAIARSGEYTIAGLPASADPASVRVRCLGGGVVSVEVRDRVVERSPEARIEELRVAISDLEHQRQALADERELLATQSRDLRSLLKLAAVAESREVRTGSVDTEAWAERSEFIWSHLRGNVAADRQLAWTIEETNEALEGLRADVGRLQGHGPLLVRDVVIKNTLAQASARFEVEYLVGGASWRPLYDLRARSDGRHARLVYNGEVSQQTGEDWSDVQLFLSSAEPHRSARGEELEGRWVSLLPERSPRAVGAVLREAVPEETAAMDSLADLGYTAETAFAAVVDEGLSVRFAVARRDTIESGDASTRVLVGETALDVDPEYHCVPSIDTTVWLRGRTRNRGEWPILAGRAAVFVGEDLLGHAELETVEVGQEFTLPLGAADAITCERVKTTDHGQGPSFFGNTRKDLEGWRLVFANNGGTVSEPDGSVRLIVREAIPRPTDTDITVSLGELSHKTDKGERWKTDREELGIETWLLVVPRHAEVELRYQLSVSYPKGRTVSFR